MTGLRLPMVGTDSTGPEWARRWLDATNAQRAAYGLPPYQHHDLAEEAAHARCDFLIRTDQFNHDDPSVPGDTYWEQLIALGATTWLTAGENLAGNLNARDPLGLALEGLMASPTHRANILATDFTHMGFWAAIRPNGWFLFAFVFLGLPS